MESNPDIFELDFNGGKIRVQRHFVANHTIYRILFADKRPALVVTRALNENAASWWTSIPEGRQKEANEIGPLIAAYILLHQAK